MAKKYNTLSYVGKIMRKQSLSLSTGKSTNKHDSSEGQLPNMYKNL